MELGFPWWLRVEHFVNIVFVTFLIRSGIEILGTMPKLYRSLDSMPGTEWARFTVRQQPQNKFFGSIDEEEDYSSIVSMPGGNKLGVGRYWHWIMVIGFVVSGALYIILLFFTGQWQRYVPTSWDVFTQAWRDIVTYASFQIPEHPAGRPFNALQQLSYGFVILILSPFQILTGFMQSPAIAARWPWLSRLLGGRQVVRSLHFIGLGVYVAFIFFHVSMVVMHGYFRETSKMVLGDSARPLLGGAIFTLGLLLVVVLHVWATRVTLKRPRELERVTNVLWRPVLRVLSRLRSRQDYPESMISPYHRSNGRCPQTPEYQALVAHHYSDYRLEIGGLVENPMTLTLDDPRELSREYSQTTVHHCVQGFTSVGKWGGVPMHRLLELARPLPGASNVAFLSFQQMDRDDPGAGGDGFFYETVSWDEVNAEQTIVAFSLNDDDIPMDKGAPLRLRLETSTGFRMCKWVERIEVIGEYADIGKGRGGWWEDVDFYDRFQQI